MIELVRVVTLLMGGFALGLTLTVGVLYHQAWRHTRTNLVLTTPTHVTMIGVAHSLLIVGLISTILARARMHSQFTWWVTPLALAGFALTIAANVQLLRSHRLRKIHSDVTAHIHNP